MVVYDHRPFRPFFAEYTAAFERQLACNRVSVLARCLDVGKLGTVYVMDYVAVAQIEIVHRHRDFLLPGQRWHHARLLHRLIEALLPMESPLCSAEVLPCAWLRTTR